MYVYLGEETAWVAALESGLVAAAFIQPPTSIAMKRKGYHVLASAADYVELPVTGLSTSVERMQRRPEEVRGMLRAVYKGLRFIKSDRGGAIRLIAQFLRVSDDVAAETYDATAKYLSDTGVSSDAAIRAAIETTGEAKDNKETTVADFGPLREVIAAAR
jgi:ABC-type nitrate/sulfonate/bicarbonate transport system substrate-binding protein